MKNIIKALYIAGETNPDVLSHEAFLLSYAKKENLASMLTRFRQTSKLEEEYFNNVINKFYA